MVVDTPQTLLEEFIALPQLYLRGLLLTGMEWGRVEEEEKGYAKVRKERKG